jgi:hypothetical protein
MQRSLPFKVDQEGWLSRSPRKTKCHKCIAIAIAIASAEALAGPKLPSESRPMEQDALETVLNVEKEKTRGMALLIDN